MSKLYIFGIGGSGARVLRSLVMLMASGVEIEAESIVPIIIDPDKSNGDLTRTVSLFNDYSKIRAKLSDIGENRFFKTKIEDTVDGFILPLNSETQETSFRQYIGMPQMKDAAGKNNANYALASALFSEDNLNATMTVGFKGNPNIGSVVLNQFEDSPEFKKFTTSFSASDKIFIINSIFGGTGASGFPLLLKNLRQLNDVRFPNSSIIRDSVIGNITILPYFQLDQPEDRSFIDSSTFISKAKAALHYYDENIIKNNSVNYVYYIADRYSSGNVYENSIGGVTQQNNAHYVELLSALAIRDFAKDSNENTERSTTEVKEYGMKADVDTGNLYFDSFFSPTSEIFKNNFIKFYIFHLYLNNHDYINSKIAWKQNHKLDDQFFTSSYMRGLKSFLKEFENWLSELSDNSRSFEPINLKNTTGDIFDFVKGYTPEREMILEKIKRVNNYSYIDHYLNRSSYKDQANSDELRFFNLFYETITEVVNKKYSL